MKAFEYKPRRIGLLSLFTIVVISLISGALCDSPVEVNFVVNPNCTLLPDECDEKPWIIYGIAEKENKTIRYLWSAVQLPTFVVASAVPDSKLQINWEELQLGNPGAISFSKVPEAVFGISFQNLTLFNDVNDTGKIDGIPEKLKKTFSLSEFEWVIDDTRNSSSMEFAISFSTSSFRGNQLPNNTKISILITAYGADGRSDKLPHLITTPGSSQVEIVLNNLILDLNNTSKLIDDNKNDQNPSEKAPISGFQIPWWALAHENDPNPSENAPISGFQNPRWALDAIIISDERSSSSEEVQFTFETKKSLDDEYAPGVFDLDSITTPLAKKRSFDVASLGGYLQWRPVCYLTNDSDINYSTFPNFNTSLPPVDTEFCKNVQHSLLCILFGSNFGNLLSTQTPIAFGSQKDGFYTKYNYTVWTFSMGLGSVPEEKFSLAIIIVICVSAGLPLLMFLAGGAYLIIKKMSRRRGDVLLIDEEE